MPPVRSSIRPLALVLACVLGSLGLLRPEGAFAEERDLEPLPREVVFTDPGEGKPALDSPTDIEIRTLIDNAYASLGTVAPARALIVERYGLVAVPALRDILAANNNVTKVWNAALTVGALRDVEGSAIELLPALKPLVKVLGSSGDAHTNAMAALALGSFHYHQGELPARYAEADPRGEVMPGIAQSRRRAAEAMKDGRRLLASNLDHPLFFFRIAVNFAMAKMGGTEVAEDFFATDPEFPNPELLRANLLTAAFLGAQDAKRFQKHLLGVEAKAAQTNVEASAALALAVAMLQEDAPDWTREARSIQRHLRGIGVALPEAHAERVFALGVCAHRNQANAAWNDVWEAATRSSIDQGVASAAAQILMHCTVPEVEARMIDLLVNPGRTPHEPVLAMALLRGGASGNADALPKVMEWLRNKARRPASNDRWDPRWYAVVGLLRALHEGRIKPKAERAQVLDALRRAAGGRLPTGRAVPGTLHKDTAIRRVLRATLDVHGAKLAAADASALYLLPREELSRVEGSFTCPHGLLARDVTDACVDRVNAMVADIFGLKNLPAWKQGADNKYMPQRFLRRHVEAHPYFSRLEFRAERGRRDRPRLPAGTPGIDR